MQGEGGRVRCKRRLGYLRRGRGRFQDAMVTETSKECVLLPVCVGARPYHCVLGPEHSLIYGRRLSIHI